MKDDQRIVMMKVADIIPYENNPRKNDSAVDPVANSIKAFGFKQPIVVDKENVVIVGHTRLKAAEKLGLTEVPVIVASDLSEEQAKAYRLADNKSGELAVWDFEALDLELSGLEDFEFDMSDFGFESFGNSSADEYIDDFFERGVEANEPKPEQFGCRIIVNNKDEQDSLEQFLKDNGYNPQPL